LPAEPGQAGGGPVVEEGPDQLALGIENGCLAFAGIALSLSGVEVIVVHTSHFNVIAAGANDALPVDVGGVHPWSLTLPPVRWAVDLRCPANEGKVNGGSYITSGWEFLTSTWAAWPGRAGGSRR
jgi:hypothetical protein